MYICLNLNFYNMTTLVVNKKSKNDLMLIEIAKKFGANIIEVNSKKEQTEYLTGVRLQAEKTNKKVSRDIIMEKLKKNAGL